MKNHFILDKIGVDIWQPRPFKHPFVDIEPVVLVPQSACINAKCLILIAMQSNLPQQPNSVLDEMLRGMIKVLGLEPKDWMCLKLYGEPLKYWACVEREVAKWMPRTVLQLDQGLPVLTTVHNVFQTYNPSYLINNIQEKRIAYQVLLKLRDCLKTLSVRQ